MEKILDFYFKVYNWLCEDHIKKGHYLPWQAHTQIVTVFSTGLLMWSYALLAHQTINHPAPTYVGYTMALLHLLSPLLLKWPGNIHLAAHVLIGSGIIHQGTFSFYSGGFNSNIIIWFGILPMLGGIILGRAGALLWAFITTSVAGVFFYQKYTGVLIQTYISEQGWLIGQAMMVFGWIFLSTILIYVFILLMEHNDREQNQKNTKIRTLVRVLCHDISNPLTTVKNRLKLIQRKMEDEETGKSMKKVDRPIEAIQSIIEQIRNWEAVESGKQELALEAVSIQDTITFVEDIFEDKLKDKDIKLNIDIPGTDLLVSGDKTTLQSQIFSNIISNAIKFSDPGSTIDVVIKDEGKMIKASISDQGLGIPENILKDLFDASKKTSRLGTGGEKGTGFGLPIVKAYVEKFGGVINVASRCREIHQEESGTTFELSFKKSV
ncbi:MAG: HAMP domain-containing histidine kinase [Halobacteriovoraceae bacterium]|nr:HAMP domain-containing histidine kinase [Halobacteriovoraceae bacterium]